MHRRQCHSVQMRFSDVAVSCGALTAWNRPELYSYRVAHPTVSILTGIARQRQLVSTALFSV